jgi:hypothetical protein
VCATLRPCGRAASTDVHDWSVALPGNRWTLNLPDGTKTNAHAVWDSVAFAWGNDKQSMQCAASFLCGA